MTGASRKTIQLIVLLLFGLLPLTQLLASDDKKQQQRPIRAIWRWKSR